MIIQHIYVDFSQRDERECILILIRIDQEQSEKIKKIEFPMNYLELNVYVFQF